MVNGCSLMRIDCALLPSMVDEKRLSEGVAVVIDVLRATTVIVTAFASGCRQVFPVRTLEEALNLREKMHAISPLLAGERGGMRIKGFDKGNSPLEFCDSSVRDASIIMTTTNGTNAILSVMDARQVVIASFRNRAAVCDYVREAESLLLVCSGTEGVVTLEDVACAGAVIDGMGGKAESCALSDSAELAHALYLYYRDDLKALFTLKSRHGRRLISLGFEDDVALCAEQDTISCIPVFSKSEGAVYRAE